MGFKKKIVKLTNEYIAEVSHQQGPEIQQSMANMADDEITD